MPDIPRKVFMVKGEQIGGAVWRALRPHQWFKNLLVLVPLVTAHLLWKLPALQQAMWAMAAFCLAASSVYVLNDLLDVEHDRAHPTKCRRPFASGALPVRLGHGLWPVLLAAALVLALWQLPLRFTMVLCGYYLLTLAYSLVLKRRMMMDVLALAALYTLRIIAGTAALSLPPSFWLLAFSTFLFLSLALVKRYAELAVLRQQGNQDRVRGRGYYADDLPMLASLGAAAGYIAVLVLALYINDPHTLLLYAHPSRIWLACPLLLAWVSYVWMITHRGEMDQDPVLFAVRDPVSLLIGALVSLAFWLAL
jgi:4-hydroxybenzoate polyprenyltransferase